MVEELVRHSGVAKLALLGTRWGALVAAAAAQRFPDTSLVLWEPSITSDRYFREAYRLNLMRAAKLGDIGDSKPLSFAEELKQRGFIDILGYSVHKALVESGRDQLLERLVSPALRDVLIIQLSNSRGAAEVYEAFVGGIRARGVDATFENAGISEQWWFHEDEVSGDGSLLHQTVTWLTSDERGR